ncbi:hypothetical protein GWO43_19425 [candidate division KSB1 bacterium]|nr:hypothetical protein [candidate division KSB1 bacterium]NIR71365.1 hypothetical protein [candidate division KSB1 bacterium]NIS26255.1 hypothetical protein [candidate division KSB1 bacterium]NIT73006.1 hypothetical protein [candidate division KSB1 bacterium]NIU26903.1 hypothetical protein [candidate division KSB1 bacterium]
MPQDKKEHLRLSQKLDLMAALFNGDSIRPILEGFTTEQLVEAHGFLWDKLVELHYLTQKREFVREEVTRNMVSSATYQHQQGCDLRLDYCKGVECIWSNPICAGNKVKNNMEVMAETITRYLNSNSSNDNSEAPAEISQKDNILF